MLIDCAPLSHLASLGSSYFNKEGLLYVREKQDGFLANWKSETYVERLCRLKGNLLFILSTHGDTAHQEAGSATNHAADRSDQVEARKEDEEASTPSSTASSSTAGDANSRVSSILVLELFAIKVSDEYGSGTGSGSSVPKHFGFTIEFARSDATRPIHFASGSHYERDSWIEAIHLASFSYLRSLYNTFAKLSEATTSAAITSASAATAAGGVSTNDGARPSSSADDTQQAEPQKEIVAASQSGDALNKCASSSLSAVLCTVSVTLSDETRSDCNRPFPPNLCVALYTGRRHTNARPSWEFLARTEIVGIGDSSQSVKFAKLFTITQPDLEALRLKLYDVTERVTDTKILLGEASFSPINSPGAFVGKRGDASQQKEAGASAVSFSLDVRSTLKESPRVGRLTILMKNGPNSRPLLPILLASSSVCSDSAAISEPANKEVAKKASGLNRPQSLSVRKSYPAAHEQGQEEEREDASRLSSSSSSGVSVSTSSATANPLSTIVSQCVPNILSPQVFNSFAPLVPLAHHYPHGMSSSATPGSSILSLSLDPQLYANTIHRSFQFEIASRPGALPIYVNELMAESTYCFMFPQTIMNIFMDDEKKLMNCVTYSLGEVSADWQRPQMRVLESHLRLVNVVTESLNELYQFQLTKKLFRPSVTKKELHLQFVPLNLHLQRCLVIEATEKRNGISNGTNGIPVANGNIGELGHEQGHTQVLDMFTVGAFAAHSLGFELGGMRSSETLELKTPTNNNNRDISHSSQSVGRVWRAMREFFRVSGLTALIDANLKLLMRQVDDLSVDERTLIKVYKQIEAWAKSLVTILNPNEVDQSLMSLDLLRRCSESDPSPKSKAAPKYERTQSYPGEHDSSRRQSNGKAEVQRRLSAPADHSEEFEPVDLLHLNIRASLISISSKLNSTRRATRADLEASRRKLMTAVESLQRTSSLAYAIESVKLEREHLESFYSMRLRRDMIFSQALSALVVAVLGQIASISFLERVCETRTIFVYFEGLLSCHADELGMLQDMAFAVDELNECVTVVLSSDATGSAVPRIEGNGLTCLLFNVGINEQATLAETFGHVKLQDEINKASFFRLENYITNQANLEDSLLIDELAALKSELYSKRAKNTRVLHLMEQITYKVNGVRFTSCKSAKDRTGMGVTLEEVRAAFAGCGLDELNEANVFQQMLDTLRSEGTRRENTRKNVGVAKYAFNSLQLMTLPKLYRPPPGTYGNVQS